MHISNISEDIHKNALAKGFWKEDNLCQKLLLIVSDITEAMEADRKNKYMNGHNIEVINGWTSDKDFIKHFEKEAKDTFEDEMADAVIRIFDLCKRKNIDLEEHIEAKCRYNKTREYLHGKKY